MERKKEVGIGEKKKDYLKERKKERKKERTKKR